MLNSFVFINSTISFLITLIIISLLISLFFINNMIIEKRKDYITKKFIFLIYIIYFILLLYSSLGIIIIWGYDIFNINFNLIIDDVSKKSVNIFITILLFIIGFFIVKVSKITVMKIINHNDFLQKRKRTIGKVTLSLIHYGVWIIGIIIFFSVWGINVFPIVAGLGILGLVIGLGAQKFINDMISGLFIILERHFDIGDIIEVKGFKGEVIDIGLKTTKIKNWLGEVKILNNGDITDITNFSLNHSMAVVEISFAYKENIDSVIKLIEQSLPSFKDAHPAILDNPQVLGVTNLASNSVNITIIAKTGCEKHYAVNRDLKKYIKNLFDENNIEIPFTQIVIHNSK